MTGWWKADSARMLHHHCRRNPELQEELQIQAAVAAGDVHTVRKMLEQGYSPNGRDANGWTLLHFSAARGKERCVRVFLEHGGEFTRCKEKLAMVLSRKCTHTHLHVIFNASLALVFSVIFSSLQRFLWTKHWVLFQTRLLSGLYLACVISTGTQALPGLQLRTFIGAGSHLGFRSRSGGIYHWGVTQVSPFGNCSSRGT